MENEGRSEVTCFRSTREENRSQAPATELDPVQAVTINIDKINHITRDIVVTAINNQKVDQAAATKKVAPLPPVIGNTNNPALHHPSR